MFRHGFRTLYLLLVILACPAHAAELELGDTRLSVEVDERQQLVMKILKDDEPMLALDRLQFNFEDALHWEITSSGRSRIRARGSFAAEAEYYRSVEDKEPRQVNLTISRVGQGFHLFAQPEWGRQVTLQLKDLGGHFFGLSEPLQPDNRLTPNLRGTSIEVEVNAEQAAMRENFASAFSAFYMSSKGYGAFFDTFARGRYDFALNGVHRIHHDTGALDWHIFPGESGADIHRAYFRIIGQPKSVPAWALGPIGWRDHNGSAAEILADIEKMNQLEIPFTAWFVDRPYSDGAHAWSGMNFSENFDNPSEWIGRIRQEHGLEFMTWTSTATFGDNRFEKHLPGAFSYLDLSHPESVEAFQDELQNNQHAHGVKGHKIDRGDENLPQYESWHHTGIPPAERRNTYSYLMAKVHDEILRESWGEDQMTFARAAIHRTQPYLSAIWGGDPRTTWQGLQANFANAARAAFMGFPVWGTDVGGYQGEGYIPYNLYIRWLQAGSMSGLFEIKFDGAGGEGRDRMPWQYSEKFQERFRRICEDRMRMIPYLYSLANTSGRTGTLMQPLAYRHLDDENTYDIWDQFYVGHAIMVAPVLEVANKRKVYFPEGQWRDFDHTGKTYEGGRTHEVAAPLGKLPRFVRKGTIFVTGQTHYGNDRHWKSEEPELTLHIYPADDDNHTTFSYVDRLDDNKLKEFRLNGDAQSLRLLGPSLPHRTRIEFILPERPQLVLFHNDGIFTHYDEEDDVLSLTIAKGQSMNLTVVR